MSAVLDVRELSAHYGGRNILDGVNLQVHAGEIVTVIGHNGAGKSTLLRAIFNLVPWRSGHIGLNGRDVMGLASDQLLQAGLAYVPQHRSVFPRLTIEENLQMGGYLVRDAKVLAERIERVLDLFPVLKPVRGNGPARCRAASSACSRSRAPCCKTPNSSCSTNLPSVWRPRWWTRCSPMCNCCATRARRC